MSLIDWGAPRVRRFADGFGFFTVLLAVVLGAWSAFAGAWVRSVFEFLLAGVLLAGLAAIKANTRRQLDYLEALRRMLEGNEG